MVGTPPMPILNATVSANANEGIWQLAQLTEESRDSIFSEKSFLPNASFVLISFGLSLNRALISRMNAKMDAMNRIVFFIAVKVQMYKYILLYAFCCREGGKKFYVFFEFATVFI